MAAAARPGPRTRAAPPARTPTGCQPPPDNSRLGGNGGTSIGGGGGGGGGGLFGGGGGGAGNGFADFDALQFFNGAGGGGGGGASGVPASAAGVSSFSLLPGIAGAEPSATFSWEPPAPAASTEAPTAVTGTTATPAAAPLVSELRLSSSRFRRGTQRARLARLRVGTTVMFRLSAAAGVRLTFERAAPGRIVGQRCLRVTRARRHGNRCTRYTRVRGGVRLTAPAGAGRIRFQGVLDGGRRLAPGAYRLSLVAVDAAGQASPAERARFRIIS